MADNGMEWDEGKRRFPFLYHFPSSLPFLSHPLRGNLFLSPILLYFKKFKIVAKHWSKDVLRISLNGTSPSYLAQKLHYLSHTRSLNF